MLSDCDFGPWRAEMAKYSALDDAFSEWMGPYEIKGKS